MQPNKCSEKGSAAAQSVVSGPFALEVGKEGHIPAEAKTALEG